MQITFVPNQRDESVQLERVKVANREFYVYTHSFLNYGLEAAQALFNKKNTDAISSEGHPCYQKNTELSWEGVKSAGSHEKCATLLDNIFDRRCSKPSCSFNDVYQPKLQGERFYAIENVSRGFIF